MFKKVYSKENPTLGNAQQFQISIDLGGGKFVDVTKDVAVDFDITLTEEKGLLPELTFTLHKGDAWLNKLRYGSLHTIKFSGGTKNPANSFKGVFVGSLFRSVGSFDKGGVTATITAFGKSWKGASNVQSFIYPSPNCKRRWGQKPSITLHEIIITICKEINLSVRPSDINIKNVEFTYEKPLRQNKTDWAFLLYIAQRMNAIVWEEKGEARLLFSRVSTLKNLSVASNRFSFVYQNPENLLRELGANQILISELSVQEDSEASLTVTRPTKADSLEESTFVDWKLNSEKVSAEFKRDSARMNRILWDVVNNTITDEVLNEFFVPFDAMKAFKDDPFIEGDNAPFLGKTCSFKIPGNTDIQSYQYYPIYNISRFSSTSSSNWWFLQKLSHTWGKDGFITELDFIR